MSVSTKMNNTEEKRELFVLGNFVGRLLEAFPVVIRCTALKDIEEAEERFCQDSEGLLQPKLAQELWKIEHNRKVMRDPRLKRKIASASFGVAIESYLANLPLKFRQDILRVICSIVSYHGTRHRKS